MDDMERKLTENLLENGRGKPKKTGWQPNAMSWLLEQSGARMKDIEKATGIKESTLSAYKAGRSSPNMSAAVKIADYFQVPLDFLVGRCSEKETSEIFDHYADYFLKLRYASYDAYLLNKYAGDNTLGGKEIFTWPYNLIESIYQLDGNECIEFDMDGLEQAISTLTEREKELIRLRYREEMTLREVADHIDRSTEVVRQALNKACRKLRHPARNRLIRYGTLGTERIRELDAREKTVAAKEQELNFREKRIEEREQKAGIDSTVVPEKDLMTDSILELDLSVRSYNCLVRSGCKTVGDVSRIAKNGKLMDIRNMGKKCAEEVLCILRDRYGVDLLEKYGFGVKLQGGIRW